METYDIGVLALGFAGVAQVEAFTKNPRTRVKAACTRDSDRLAEVCEQYGIEKACATFDELLAADLDVLVIATRTTCTPSMRWRGWRPGSISCARSPWSRRLTMRSNWSVGPGRRAASS